MTTGQTARAVGGARVSVGEVREYGGNLYRCRAVVAADAGGYVAASVELPAVHARGSTEGEALGALTDSLAGAIRTYREAGTPVPWVNRDAPSAPGMKAVFVQL